MGRWEFTHSVLTRACRADAWAYWSDMQNHARMEPGVERIELDGPFVAGTAGRTISNGFAQEWQLTEVVDGQRFVVTGLTPDGAGSLSFAWEFEDAGTGTRLTQRIRADGPDVEAHLGTFRQMEAGAQRGMAQLVAQLDRLSQE